MSLGFYRDCLFACLASLSEADWSWPELKPRILDWWRSYKQWEACDTFNVAFRENRMSVRTFDTGFSKQVNKKISSIDLTAGRFFEDSKYKKLGPNQRNEATKTLQKVKTEEGGKVVEKIKLPENYWADRGIDSDAFANPANFATRNSKYDNGLHDLSASLLNPDLSIFDQIHNTDNGAHFAFMPLAQPEDQCLIYGLVRVAKIMRPYWPEMYALIRDYRARMTRVKIAQNFDMGVGYIAIPVANPGPDDRKFKIRYGLVQTITVPSQKPAVSPDKGPVARPVAAQSALKTGTPPPAPGGKGPKMAAAGYAPGISMTPEIYEARQQAALNYKSILNREGKNEIVIALRQHAGDFPVSAIRDQDKLLCYNIVGGKMIFDYRMISASGVITRMV